MKREAPWIFRLETALPCLYRQRKINYNHKPCGKYRNYISQWWGIRGILVENKTPFEVKILHDDEEYRQKRRQKGRGKGPPPGAESMPY